MLWEITKQIEGHTICALGDAAAWPVQVGVGSAPGPWHCILRCWPRYCCQAWEVLWYAQLFVFMSCLHSRCMLRAGDSGFENTSMHGDAWLALQGLIRHFRPEMEARIGQAAERIAA